VAQVNPRTIVVLHGGGGFDVQSWIDRVPALLHAWFPGQYGGQALAEILFGAIDPSGKLPITMEKQAQDNPAFAGFPTDLNATTINYSEGLFVGYRGYEKNQIQPQYPFGYGLSYTTFRYSDLDVDPVMLNQGDQDEHGLTKADWKERQGDEDRSIRVSFLITNTGDRAGAETAQLYVAPVNPPVVRPVKELKGFTKVYLAPGESRRVTINLDRRSLAYYDVSARAWDVARGLYRILVGSSSQDTRLQGAFINLVPAQLSVLKSKPVLVQNAD
jgi:beta-glucosidase